LWGRVVETSTCRTVLAQFKTVGYKGSKIGSAPTLERDLKKRQELVGQASQSGKGLLARC